MSCQWRMASWGSAFEFQHISMDGTLRVLRRVKGQVDYQASAVEKEAQVLPEHEAKRKILTIMGSSGTCLGLPLVRDEGPEDIATALRHMWPPEYLQSIVSVNTDAPSKELWRSLSAIMPALLVISLDPVHLAINYETAFSRNRTKGSADLRFIMNKLNKFSEVYSADQWGPVFTGTDLGPEDHNLAVMRGNILQSKVSLSVATRILAEVDPDTPWETMYHFTQAVAALVTVHEDEMRARTESSIKTTRRLLWNAADPARLGWYFNNQRMRHLPGVKSGITRLTGSGTSTNEAFHKEINRWYSNQPDLYAGTVQLQLRFARLGRLISHSQALMAPTVRGMTQGEVLSRSIGHVRQPFDMWAKWCEAGMANGRPTNQKGQLPLAQERKIKHQLITASSSGRAHRAVTGPSSRYTRRGQARGTHATQQPRHRLSKKTTLLDILHRNLGAVLKRPSGATAQVTRTMAIIPSLHTGKRELKRTPFSLGRTRKLVRTKASAHV